MKSCKEIIRAMGQEKNRRFKDRIEEKLHLLFCKFCNHYQKNLAILSNYSLLKTWTMNDKKKEQLEQRILDEFKSKSIK